MPVTLLGRLAPGYVLHPHLVHYPLWLPILAFLVPVFLFGRVRADVISPKLLVMLTSHVGVSIVLLIVPVDVAPSIAAVASLSTALPPRGF